MQVKLGYAYANAGSGYARTQLTNKHAILIDSSRVGQPVISGAGLRALQGAPYTSDGTVTMLWRMSNEQGFDLLTWQPKQYVPINIDGLWLTLRPVADT